MSERREIKAQLRRAGPGQYVVIEADGRVTVRAEATVDGELWPYICYCGWMTHRAGLGAGRRPVPGG